MKERYRKAQKLAIDLQKEIKQRTQRMDDETISDSHRNRVIKLQQENTKLKKTMGFLEAKLKVSQKHLKERFVERGVEWLELDAAHKKIEELRLELDAAHKKLEELHLQQQLKQEFESVNLLREELEKKLQKSFIAYNEKYYECEELKKTLEKYDKFGDVADSVKVWCHISITISITFIIINIV